MPTRHDPHSCRTQTSIMWLVVDATSCFLVTLHSLQHGGLAYNSRGIPAFSQSGLAVEPMIAYISTCLSLGVRRSLCCLLYFKVELCWHIGCPLSTFYTAAFAPEFPVLNLTSLDQKGSQVAAVEPRLTGSQRTTRRPWYQMTASVH